MNSLVKARNELYAKPGPLTIGETLRLRMIVALIGTGEDASEDEDDE